MNLEEKLSAFRATEVARWHTKVTDPTDPDTAALISAAVERACEVERKRLEKERVSELTRWTDVMTAAAQSHALRGFYFKVFPDGHTKCGRVRKNGMED